MLRSTRACNLVSRRGRWIPVRTVGAWDLHGHRIPVTEGAKVTCVCHLPHE